MTELKYPSLVGEILHLASLSIITIIITSCSPIPPEQQILPSPTSTIQPTTTPVPTNTETAVPDTPIPPTPTASPIPSLTPVKVTDADDLVGLWHGHGRDGMYFQFNQDGTCQQTMVRDTLDTNPNIICEYRFDGDQFVLTILTVEGLPPCQQPVAIYEIHRLDNGNIKFVNVDDRCQPRVRSTAVEHEPIH